MIRLGLVVLMAMAAIAAGCGDDDGGGNGDGAAGAATTEDAMTEESGDAMEKDRDAMKEDGDAMEEDGARKKDGDAMKQDGDAMRQTEGAAMREEGATAAASGRRRARGRGRGRGRGRTIRAVRSEYGRVVADGKGEAFYLFDKERGSRSRCYGDCAVAWPPVLTRGRPRAGRGVKASRLGTTRRRGGRLQVTYGGHPLYYYKDDSPGTILCQNVDEFGGLWLVVKPSGRPVRGR